MTVFSKTSYTEFHKSFQHHTYKGEHKAHNPTKTEGEVKTGTYPVSFY